jgi:hypothetical protein
MTELSEQMKSKVCTYCGNNEGGCTADVPYYAVSLFCDFFIEEKAETKSKRGQSDKQIMRRILNRTLVDTV